MTVLAASPTVLAASPMVPGSWAAEQFFAGLAVVGVVILIRLAGRFTRPAAAGRGTPSAPGGLVTGLDNRYSTGKLIAVGWTILVAWMVVTEAFIGGRSSTSFSDLLSGASDLYFVFLGGPYAAAVFAKASVQSKISAGTIAKTAAPDPSPFDVIADDNGNVDVYDFQYVLFNVLAWLIVAVTFGAHPGHGLPDIPQFLAILTGGAALTYTVNKAVVSDGPAISGVSPAEARIGDTVTITGTQPFAGPAGSPLPTVVIGTVAATAVTVTGANTLTATVVDAPAGTTPLTGPVPVTVTPASGPPIVLRNAVRIVADTPAVTGVTPQPFQPNGPITVAGRFLLPPGTAPATVAAGSSPPGGLTATLTASGQDWPVSFQGPCGNEAITLQVGAQPAGLPGNPGDEQQATLVLARGTAAAQATVRYLRS